MWGAGISIFNNVNFIFGFGALALVALCASFVAGVVQRTFHDKSFKLILIAGINIPEKDREVVVMNISEMFEEFLATCSGIQKS